MEQSTEPFGLLRGVIFFWKKKTLALDMQGKKNDSKGELKIILPQKLVKKQI